MKATEIIDTLCMEKTAGTRWKRFIDASPDAKVLRRRVGHLLRDDPIFERNPIRGDSFVEDIITQEKPMPDLLSEAKDYVGSRYQHRRNAMERMHESGSPRDLKTRKDILFRSKMERRGTGKPVIDSESNELVPIIHGSEHSRIQSFLSGGNGAYPTDVRMDVGGKQTRKGIMVHSLRGERSPDYAYRASGYRGGLPAIMTGKIPKKYLYHNNDYSGYGDEFAIPKEYYDKIVDSKVITPESPEWPHTKAQTNLGMAGSIPFGYSNGLYDKLRGK